jgi:hypothetical protein
MVNDKPAATTHDGSEDIVTILNEGTELTHEQYLEELAEMGLDPEQLTQEDDETQEALNEIGRITIEATTRLAEQFQEFSEVITGGSFSEMVEMQQRLEPKHARSPKRHLLHKKAVENRKRRKRGGKK